MKEDVALINLQGADDLRCTEACQNNDRDVESNPLLAVHGKEVYHISECMGKYESLLV